jgi:glycosyltransferase involved in cell wall biosynthesis
MKILLISDASLCVDRGGISQTLYNLFSFANDIVCVTPNTEFSNNPPTEPFSSCYITYKFEIINFPNNRLSKFVKPFANWFNYSFNNVFRNFKKIRRQIAAYNPDVVICCPHTPAGLLVNNKLLKGINVKIIPYLMDYWMSASNLKWIGGSVQKSTAVLLSNNESWLMISKNLSSMLEERYQIRPKNLLEIHNPVDISNAQYIEPVIKPNEYTVAYAGALWAMNLDSLIVVANSISKLNNKFAVKFVVYTSKEFWEWRKPELEPLGVIFGGSILYKNIHSKLQQADALLLTTSFLKQYYTISKGSLQTKVTDYLKAKRLIISCGPDYSANHIFLKKHNCGVCIETNNVDDVTKSLNEILNNLHKYQNLVSNGWDLLNNEFTFQKVHKKLIDFISDPVSNN